jgi:thymidylate synthase ThyX
MYDVLSNVSERRINCLDHGFVELVDCMPRLVPEEQKTADFAVVQAARVSYGPGTKTVNEDRGLIRYLFRHRHSTPAEMVKFKFHAKMPIFVARQWIRHRMGCLTGDTQLVFDLPSGTASSDHRAHPLTMQQVYERWQPTQAAVRPDRQGKPLFRRERVQKMRLRCLNTDTNEPSHTQIADIWQTGIQHVYRVTLSNGIAVTMTADHRCLTNTGWLPLKECAQLPTAESPRWQSDVEFATLASVSGSTDFAFNEIDEATECWRPVVGWVSWYEVSDQGRVKRIAGGQGVHPDRGCKKPSAIDNGHAVVSLNRPGCQEVRLVHQLVLEAFVGPCPAGMEGCHNDGNGLNNNVANLRWGTPRSNADDRIKHGVVTKLRRCFHRAVQIDYLGLQQTYDMEVLGPHHNFAANGMIVHNSFNEVSARYSVLPNENYLPLLDDIRQQSTRNKQGGETPMDATEAATFNSFVQAHGMSAYAGYEAALSSGVSREQARMVLPLNQYTEWYWSLDLHNLMHFLALRCDRHAQKEIRVFGDALLKLITPIVPWCVEAWEDYHPLRGALLLTRLEVEALRKHLATYRVGEIDSNNKREREEWQDKCGRLGLQFMPTQDVTNGVPA